MSDGPTVEQGGRVIHIPMTLKKQGGRKEIIVPEGLPQSRPRSPAQEPLVVALARTFHWQDLIDGGRYASITELARALDVDRSYVGRITGSPSWRPTSSRPSCAASSRAGSPCSG